MSKTEFIHGCRRLLDALGGPLALPLTFETLRSCANPRTAQQVCSSPLESRQFIIINVGNLLH